VFAFGGTAIAIGVLMLISALANWDWYKGIMDLAVVEGLLGEDAAARSAASRASSPLPSG
jgi:hypothetical protein